MRRNGLWITLLIVLGCTALAGAAMAQSGGQVTLPGPTQNGKPIVNRTGLTVSVDSTWVASFGYRPISVKIIPTAPVTADRTLIVRMIAAESNFYGYGDPSFAFEVNKQIDIPAGSGVVTKIIPLPQHFAIGQVKFDIFEDGQHLDALSTNNVFINPENPNGMGGPPLGYQPTVLAIGDPAEPWATSFAGLQQRALFAKLKLPAVRSSLNQPAPHVDDLPDQWIDYSGIDCFAIRQFNLEALIAQHPSRWAAIRATIAAGATLLVFDAATERRQELDKLLDLQAGAEDPDAHPPDDSKATEITTIPKWRPATRNQQAVEIGSGGDENQLFVNGLRVNQPVVQQSAQKLNISERSLCRGLVAAIPRGIPQDQSTWNEIFHYLPANRAGWCSRHGLAMAPNEVAANRSDFWQFLIPGVGLTPVLQFQILITLFVLVIGPLNFYLLRRWQRLNLLVFTAPITAALVTLLLVGYAMLADGLGVRLRARTFTEIDQRRGEAVCWSRLSYYAGLTPGQDLQFSGDVAVYPLRQESNDRAMDRSGPKRQWDWVDVPATSDNSDASRLAQQRLSRDWIAARTPTQFVTVRSRKSPARLDVRISPDGASATVANRLGAHIRQLFIRDTADHYFSAKDIASGSTSVLSQSAPNSFVRIDLGDPLSLPAGAQLDWFEQPNYSFRGPRSYSNSGSTVTPQAAGMLEAGLREASVNLQPGRFVAIVDRSPEMEPGVESAREEASLHVMAGNW